MKITVPTVVLSFWLSGVAAAQVIRPDAGETRRVGDRRTFFPAAHGARADLPPPWRRTGPGQLATTGEDPDLRARRLDNFITFQGSGGFATPDDLDALEACQAGFRTGAGVPWSDISRACTASTEASPAAPPTKGRCASSGDSGRR